jgi:hypothetical protein
MEARDIVEDIGSRLSQRLVAPPFHTLAFEHAEEPSAAALTPQWRAALMLDLALASRVLQEIAGKRPSSALQQYADLEASLGVRVIMNPNRREGYVISLSNTDPVAVLDLLLGCSNPTVRQ